ncbi:hypothetical protein LJC19_07490 [Oxalobacter sp. OttesenSCG-928-P03]|nr:hypothetical protein [Oxalobacter sp. OttesenSCG-928-P03]
MYSNARAKSVLRAVAEGKTLTEAGKLIGVKATRASQLLSKICRELKLPNDLSEIRSRKEEYIQKIISTEDNQLPPINQNIAYSLAKALRLKKVGDLTPQYLSNISASQLVNAGVTFIALADAQRWLVRQGMSLKRHPPENKTEILAVQRAIATLDAFHFDTSLVRSQLHYLESNDD